MYYNNMFNAFGQYPSLGIAQRPQLIRVSGVEGAKAYQMPPDSSVALFHESEDILYVKTTDGAGFPTIRTFRFEPLETETPVQQYVTMEEFNKFKEELNGKFTIREAEQSAK